jgi:hypothetical protein
MTTKEIEAELIRLDQTVKEFKQELFRISWFMRGGISVNDLLFYYSHDDREAAYEVIKTNLENTKQSQMPLL